MTTCCPTSVLADADFQYTPQGSGYCYKVGTGPAVLLIPDIFGYHPRTVELADLIAKRGYTVYYFDYFAGKQKHWNLGEPIVPDSPAWQAFLGYITGSDVQKQIVASCAYVTAMNDGAAPCCVGLCWGANRAALLAKDGLVSCAVMAHPSFVNVEAAEATEVPWLLAPSEDDGEMLDVKKALEERAMLGGYLFAKGSVHGYAAARHGKGKNGIVPDAENRAALLDLIGGFFGKITAAHSLDSPSAGSKK
jgi:dienelactone hydrolase